MSQLTAESIFLKMELPPLVSLILTPPKRTRCNSRIKKITKRSICLSEKTESADPCIGEVEQGSAVVGVSSTDAGKPGSVISFPGDSIRREDLPTISCILKECLFNRRCLSPIKDMPTSMVTADENSKRRKSSARDRISVISSEACASFLDVTPCSESRVQREENKKTTGKRRSTATNDLGVTAKKPRLVRTTPVYLLS